MKKLLLLLFIVVFYNAQAQQILFKEDFNTYPGLNIPNWTTTASGNSGWRTSDFYNLYCSNSYIPEYVFWAKVAAISGCYGDKGGPRNNMNVFMYSKGINLSTVQTGAVLKFDSYFNKFTVGGKTERATVEVSVNNGASWTVLYDVPAGLSYDSMYTWHVNLSAYIGYGNVCIGFRYSDQGGNQYNGGWTIDNIELYRPAQTDLTLQSFTPTDSLMAYTTINTAYNHTGVVFNSGLDTIKEFVINYSKNNGPAVADAITATIPPLASYNFSHAVPDTITQAGENKITAWVSTVGDGIAANDTFRTTLYGAYFMPKKLVVIEEGTGTWSGFGPRGIIYFERIMEDNDACLISIHELDSMKCQDYADYIYNLNQYYIPYYLFDRRENPSAFTFFRKFDKYKQHFGYADIDLNGYLAGTEFFLSASVKPALDLKGDFRLAMVLVEDGLTGTDSSWAQKNFYANGLNGPMGRFSTRPDSLVPAAEMRYNNVARAILPAPGGDSTFAKELKYGTKYDYKFHTWLKPEWNKDRLRAMVMLLRNDDTVILNANKLTHFLSVKDINKDEQLAGIYPNPADAFTTLELDMKRAGRVDIALLDMNGRVVSNYKVEDAVAGKNTFRLHTAALPTGVYIINARTQQDTYTLKLQVVH